MSDTDRVNFIDLARDQGLELQEYSSEIIRQMREIAALHRQVDTMARTIVDLSNQRDQLRRDLQGARHA